MDQDQSKKRPSYLKFRFSIHPVPWTDGVGNQEAYTVAVQRWCQLRDVLPDTNSNKVSKRMRGLCLHSNLYDRAEQLYRELDDSVLSGQSAPDKIVNLLYKCDGLAVVKNTLAYLYTLISL